MHGTVSDEKVVKVAASEAWKLFGTLQLAKFMELRISASDLHQNRGLRRGRRRWDHPPRVIPSGHIQGDGQWFKEKLVVVDDEKRVKMVEGGYLNLGFTLYRFRVEVIEAVAEQCIVRRTIEYELKEEAAANAALASIQPLTALMQLAAH